MAESFGAGGPSGSSGVLSSTMRSIVRQSGDPQDHEQRRIEDVVDLSPLAARQRQSQDTVQPTEPADTLRNPGEQAQTLTRARAEGKAEEAEAAAREASRKTEPANAIDRPVNIGLAAAISIGSPVMVDRYDVNGDEYLDQRERNRAIDQVTSEDTYHQAKGANLFRSGEHSETGDPTQGEAYFAEMEAKKADAAQNRAEAQAKAEQARADRLSVLDEQQQARASGDAERAYERSGDLDARQPRPPQDLEA